MTSDAQRRAVQAYDARLRAAGVKIVSVRLSQAARDRLNELAKASGSVAKALEALLLNPD